MPRKTEAPASNRLFIPSRSAVEDEHGSRHISSGAMARGDRAALHFWQNNDRFREKGAFILCSGSHAKSAHGQTEAVDPPQREANLLADYLMNTHGVPHQLIEREDESSSLFSNVALSVLRHKIEPTDYDPDNRLGLVLPGSVMRRGVFNLRKVGVPAAAIERLYVEGENDLSGIKQFAGLVASHYYALGAHGPQDLLKAEARFDRGPLAGRS